MWPGIGQIWDEFDRFGSEANLGEIDQAGPEIGKIRLWGSMSRSRTLPQVERLDLSLNTNEHAHCCRQILRSGAIAAEI